MITFGSLFSGIGGIDLGLERAGMVCKWQVEIDDFCQKVLQKHWPEVRKYRDVREVGKHNLEPVDLIAGGFPCQDVSTNGLRRGLEGQRSTLWDEYARIISEIKPRWILAENVLGLFSANDGWFFSKVLIDLANLGYSAGWSTISTGYFSSLPHQRNRVFVVAYPTSERWEAFEIYKKISQENKRISGKYSSTNDKEVWRISNSDFCGEANGIPNWMDRLKSLGNAVVPQVAEYIGRCIVEADKSLTQRR